MMRVVNSANMFKVSIFSVNYIQFANSLTTHMKIQKKKKILK